MPLIPGHEFSGQVVGISEQIDSSDKAESGGESSGKDETWIGRRVGVFPLIPCRKCGPCNKGLYEMCRSYDYVGSRRDGAFAEYVSAPVDNLIELPDEVSYEEAAMLEPMAVAVHAMRRGLTKWAACRGDIHIGDDAVGVSDIGSVWADEQQGTLSKGEQPVIAVCGLGTIGLLLTMFLIDAGMEDVYVIGNKDFQKKKALELGIREDHYIDGRSDDGQIGSLKGKIDVYFECVGKNECVSLGIDMAAPAGTVVMVGNPASDMRIDRDIYWKILRNQLRVTGTWNSSFDLTGSHDVESMDDWTYVIERLRSGGIRPKELISHELDMEELERGLLIMRDKVEDYCKVMIRP